jgi:hypothetical protein
LGKTLERRREAQEGIDRRPRGNTLQAERIHYWRKALKAARRLVKETPAGVS